MPVSPQLVAEVGGLSKNHPADHPVLLAKKNELAEQSLIYAVERALAKAPPLRSEIREKIVGMLSA